MTSKVETNVDVDLNVERISEKAETMCVLVPNYLEFGIITR